MIKDSPMYDAPKIAIVIETDKTHGSPKTSSEKKLTINTNIAQKSVTQESLLAA